MRLVRNAWSLGLVTFAVTAGAVAACGTAAEAPTHASDDAGFDADAGAMEASDGRAPDVDPSPRPYVASASCSLKSPAQWQAFLEATVVDARWVKTCSDLSDCDTLVDFSNHVKNDVLGVLGACAQDRVDNPGVAACTEHLVRYAPAWVRQHAVGTYGFDQENADYFAQVVPDGPQGMMTPPAALLAAMPTQTAIVATAREQGWPYLVHDSGLGGVRTLIAITDAAGRFEQWMVLGVSDGDALTGPSIMSFLAVQLTHADGSGLKRPRVYFRDFVLSPGPTGWSAALPPEFDGKCYACHGTGPRALIPLHGSIVSSAPVNGEPGYGTTAPAGFGFTRLQSLNARLLAYGPPDWNGTLEPADHGPPLGAKLGCPSCHNGVVRGPVTVSTSEGMLAQKVLHQLSMRASTHGEAVPDEGAIALLDRESTKSPPLTNEEKAALAQAKAAHLADYQALIADRFPSWQAWILETPCK